MNNIPKPGEVWKINNWSPEYIREEIVIVITEEALPEADYGEEVKLFRCLSGDSISVYPIWMFQNAEKIESKSNG